MVRDVPLMISTDILEFSNIAWPNAAMWKKPSGPALNANSSMRIRPATLTGEDVHAHSPRRPTGWNRNANTDNGLPGPSAYPEHKRHQYADIKDSRTKLPRSGSFSEPRLNPPQTNLIVGSTNTAAFPSTDDPFMGDGRGSAFLQRSKRSTLDDTPMPDYASSVAERNRANSDMTGLSYGQMDGRMTIDLTKENAIEEFIKRLSPEKRDELFVKACSPTKPTYSGTQAPSNTPSSSTEPPTQASVGAQGQISLHAETPGQDLGTGQLSPDGRVSSGVTVMLKRSLVAKLPVFEDEGRPNQLSSDQRRAKAVQDNGDKENEVESRSTSIEITRSASNSFKVALPGMDRQTLSQSDINRPRSNSSGSKRKRSSSPAGNGGPASSLLSSPNK